MNIRVTIFEQEQFFCSGADWPPENAIGFIEWFKSKLYLIPVEYRDDARIKADVHEDYEGAVEFKITIFYERPETEGESRLREDRIKASIAMQTECERDTFERLKSKFEPKTL